MNLGIFSRRGPQAVGQYGAPGHGRSTAISAVTIVLILGSWWLVTQLELVRPLFLPSPEMVISKFNKIACTEHYVEKLLTAFGARAEVEAQCHGFQRAYPARAHPLEPLPRIQLLLPGGDHRNPHRGRDGNEPPRARRLRPAESSSTPDSAARLSAADHHLVRKRSKSCAPRKNSDEMGSRCSRTFLRSAPRRSSTACESPSDLASPLSGSF